jgi:hypothetical protein
LIDRYNIFIDHFYYIFYIYFFIFFFFVGFHCFEDFYEEFKIVARKFEVLFKEDLNNSFLDKFLYEWYHSFDDKVFFDKGYFDVSVNKFFISVSIHGKKSEYIIKELKESFKMFCFFKIIDKWVICIKCLCFEENIGEKLKIFYFLNIRDIGLFKKKSKHFILNFIINGVIRKVT